ncbi:MAG: hypothetical protein ACOX05_03310 [Bacillota bacterium]|jgi:uncharacterized membrane protein (DUF485 family)
MSPLELTMLLCFGAAWPASIYRSYKSASTQGKSVVFLFILLAGYTAGILNKRIFFPADPVVIFYVVNLVMVAIDTLLYFRNRRLEKQYDKDYWLKEKNLKQAEQKN